MEDKIVISLGGSLIVPEEIDIDFLKSFKELIIQEIAKGKKFILITGGGRVCRKYQGVAKEISNTTPEDLDWIGIASLKLNAELLRVIFKDYAYEKVIENLSLPFPFEKPIVIGSAYEPGHSTDFDAVLGAQSIGAKMIINLSNTDYVYDSDPKTNPNAQKIETITWGEYTKIIPKEWHPGLSTPFDPTASVLAEKEGITVISMNGKPISNLANCLNGEAFVGTTIKP